MLAVQTVEALNHVRSRRGLEGGGTMKAMLGPKPPILGSKEDLREGSDGETSDYQRSTPSPRDTEAMVMELGSEGLEKVDSPPSPPTHWGSKALHPDLGFVDGFDSSTSSTSSTSSLPYSSSSSSSPYSSQLDSHISSSLARLSSLTSLTVTAHPVSQSSKPTLSSHSSHSSLLSKQLKVQLEKLPLPLLRGERKRSLLTSSSSSSSSTSSFSGGKKRRSQELVISNTLFNSFRISKPPKSSNDNVSKTEKLNLSFSHNAAERKARIAEEKEEGEKVKEIETASSSSSSGTPSPHDIIVNTTKKTEIIAKTPATNSIPSDISLPSSLSSSTCSSSAPSSTTSSIPSSPLPLRDDVYDLPGVHDVPMSESHLPAPGVILDPTDSSFVLPRKLRFPCSSSGSTSEITCKWQGCLLGFKTHGKLSDHIKVHVSDQLDSSATHYVCLWEGCKVFGKPSSSRGWVEKHVPQHGGKFAFTCIVEGCRHRFSSQVMLERHVNNHFSESGSSKDSSSGPRKSIESADTARKRLKRAGVRLKFRQLPFSARIFDFFDAGNMAGIRHLVADLEERSEEVKVEGDRVRLTATVLGTRVDPQGHKMLNVRWKPENFLPDEWVEEGSLTTSRWVKLSLLSQQGKDTLSNLLLPRPERTKHPRKQKRVNTNTDFLTPDEAEQLKFEDLQL